jgi:hypothetical protein
MARETKQQEAKPVTRPTPLSSQGSAQPPKSDATPVPTRPADANDAKESTRPANANKSNGGT